VSRPGGPAQASGRESTVRGAPSPSGRHGGARLAVLPELPELPEHDQGSAAARPRGPYTTAVILRLAAPPASLALLATLIFAAVFAALRSSQGFLVNAWLLTLGSIVVWFCWRVLASALPALSRSAFDSVRDRPSDPPSRLDDVIDVEAAILDAEWSWTGVEHRLRPLLRRIATARLVEKYQIDLERQPDAARKIMGEELWALVGPGSYGPADVAPETQAGVERRTAKQRQARSRDRHRRGIPRATIERTIEQLEAL
jgi:hypothetical protein